MTKQEDPMATSANIKSGETGQARGRRLAFASVFVAIAVVISSLTLAATAGARGGVDNSTSLAGTSEWTDQTTAIHGTFSGRLGTGTYAGNLSQVLTGTTNWCGPLCFTVTGEITFSSNRGDFTAVVEPGSLMREQDIASTSFREFVLQLTVVDGTRSYKHAEGELSLSYGSTWTHTVVDGVFVNEINDEGSLTGNPRR
jgi:hypothetical protein